MVTELPRSKATKSSRLNNNMREVPRPTFGLETSLPKPTDEDVFPTPITTLYVPVNPTRRHSRFVTMCPSIKISQ